MLKGFSVQQVLGASGPANSILFLNSSGVPGGVSALAFDGTGQITLNRTNGSAGLLLQSSDSGTSYLFFGDQSSTTVGRIEYNHASDFMAFFMNNTEKGRWLTGGTLLIGKQSANNTLAGCELSAAGAVLTRSDGDCLLVNRETSDGTVVSIRRSNSTVGTIAVTTTGTSYNQTSDYRLKDKPQALTGSGDFIDSLKPKTWVWKINGAKGVGFIAHEVQQVSPSSVIGDKDAVDDDGNIAPQVMQYGSPEFIANIVAELQSLRIRVKRLEA